MPKKQVTARKRYEISRTIEDNGKSVGEFWEYNDGWDDKKVARQCGVNTNTTCHIRLTVFGKLTKTALMESGQVSNVMDTYSRLSHIAEDLADRLQRIEKFLGDLGYEAVELNNYQHATEAKEQANAVELN